jgi:POTRA domain, FtsQ-type
MMPAKNSGARKNFVNFARLVRHRKDVMSDGAHDDDNEARSNASRLMVWLLCASLIAVGGAASYTGYVFFNNSERFALSHIELHGNERASRDEILRYLALTQDDNVFSIDLDVLRESLRRHPWIADVSIRRVVPDTLIIDVKEQVPVAIVALSKVSASKLYYINESFEPFSRVYLQDAPDLPMLTGLDMSLFDQRRERWNELTALGISFYAAAKRAGFALAEIELDESIGVIAHLLPAGTTAHMGKDDFDTKIRRLRDVRALLEERGQSADSFLLDNPRHKDAIVARLNPSADKRAGVSAPFVGAR